MGKISPFEILGETFTNVFRRARYFLPIALVIGIVSGMLNAYLMESMIPDSGAQNATAIPENFWRIWAIAMLALTTIQLVQMSLFDAVMQGRTDWLPFGIKRALWRTIPALVGMILFMLAYVIGVLLLVIPGLMVLFLLYMMMPLILLDGAGPFEAVKKSWQLTWGNAWRLLGAILLVFFPVMLVFWPAAAALGYFSFDPQQSATASLLSWSDWQTWAWIVLSSIMGMLLTSFYLVTFKALKAAKADGGNAIPDMVPA